MNVYIVTHSNQWGDETYVWSVHRSAESAKAHVQAYEDHFPSKAITGRTPLEWTTQCDGFRADGSGGCQWEIDCHEVLV